MIAEDTNTSHGMNDAKSRPIRGRKTGEKTPGRDKWDPRMAIDAFILVREGKNMQDVAKVLGVDGQTVRAWRQDKDLFRYAWDRALGVDANGKKELSASLPGYIYGLLPPEVKKVWDRLEYWSEHENGYTKIEQLMKGQTRRVQQMLFVNATVVHGFNPSVACRMCALDRITIDRWLEEDPDFAKLVEEVDWHRKNFFEQALTDLVQARNPFAVIFANKTKNRDRGYGERAEVEVKHSGAVEHHHSHTVVSVDLLKLPLEVRCQLLDAVEAHQEDLRLQQLNRTKELPAQLLAAG